MKNVCLQQRMQHQRPLIDGSYHQFQLPVVRLTVMLDNVASSSLCSCLQALLPRDRGQAALQGIGVLGAGRLQSCTAPVLF